MFPISKTWINGHLSKLYKSIAFFFTAITLLNTSIGNSLAFQCSDVAEIPETECEALVALFDNTNGMSWNVNTGWKSSNTPCDWFGVTCRDGNIVYINLNNNGLQNGLPNTIGDFNFLEYLNLSDNELTGQIPDTIGQLTDLQQLWLAGNQFTSLPESIEGCSGLTLLWLRENQLSSLPTGIGNLSNLVHLSLYSNNLTSESFPESFRNLISLETLSLHNNLLTTLPNSVTDLVGLKGIDLSWNQHLSLAGIGNLTSLESLRLHCTGQTELPDEMTLLTSLRILWLQGNLFTDFPLVVTEIPTLETLLFTYNPQLSGPLPQQLTNLTNMSEFAFDGTNLCIPNNPNVQNWLVNIPTVRSSGILCNGNGNGNAGGNGNGNAGGNGNGNARGNGNGNAGGIL